MGKRWSGWRIDREQCRPYLLSPERRRFQEVFN
ncbi:MULTISPECIES: DUF3653 domain-containing protein [Chryseobacterium]